MVSIEKKLQHALAPFLRGPDLCQFALLRARGEEEYRSSALAMLAWAIALLRRFFYPVTLYLALPFLLLQLMLLFFPEEPLWSLVWLAAGLFAAELLLGLLCHPRVTVIRRSPPHVDEGETFSIRFTVTNRRRLTAGTLELDPFDYLSFALKTLKRAQTKSLRRGESVTVESRLLACRRGVWQLYRARAGSAFPFGLIRFQCIAPKDSAALLRVWPRRLDASLWQIAEKAQDLPGGRSGRAAADQMADLAGVREYRPGDPLRQIDWVGTARRGEFLVKQFELRKAVRRLVFYVDDEDLRSWFFRRRHLLTNAPSFERALAIARTLAEEAVNNGARPVRLHLGDSPTTFPEETPASQAAAAFCDKLASAFPRRRPLTFSELPAAEGVAEAIVILQRDDPNRRTAVKRLRRQTQGRLVVFSASPLAPEAPPGWVDLSEGKR